MAEFASSYETLLLRRERSRLHVTLNRPEVKNALNPTLIGELRSVFSILRERRDPGLLEWTAGNLFKARVFPIEPHSEKRIKIVYTQVLPLRGGKYRYSDGLQSDLLKLHPVRELSIDVLVNSALPLNGIECPTHDVQKQLTKHSGQVRFSAREHVPQRDFEVVCSVAAKQNDVVVVPHQRGDDGYLLVQVTPPGSDGDWQIGRAHV